ncbi:hypothetical protein QMK33_09130 [Hymenobacter sp. H14-R3]|uniref:hypothetical protein n=1 Tax=Hymenobacter sp. H14-R3 TaxID=3046308 RepID=UPI0024B99943|nr:hypothetical protein [Hymenobacter sp. H14-R3]MDJ0365316.1 hypothetical protein [Hymenobacter sp. H14-R3]
MDFPSLQPQFRFPTLLLAVGVAGVLVLYGAAVWVAGLVGLAVVLGLSSLGTGLEFSPDLQRYRQYLELRRWRVGRWQSLPLVVGITLKYYSAVSKDSALGSSNKYAWKNPKGRHQELIVMLSQQRSATGIIMAHFSLDAVNDAIDFAHELADRFQVPVNQYLPTHLFQPLPAALGSSAGE